MPFSLSGSSAPLRSLWELSSKQFSTCCFPGRRPQRIRVLAGPQADDGNKPVTAAEALTQTLSGTAITPSLCGSAFP